VALIYRFEFSDVSIKSLWRNLLEARLELTSVNYDREVYIGFDTSWPMVKDNHASSNRSLITLIACKHRPFLQLKMVVPDHTNVFPNVSFVELVLADKALSTSMVLKSQA